MARPPGPRPAAVCARVRSWKQCAPLQSRLSGNLALGLLRRTGHPRRGSVEPRGVACRPLERLAGAAPPLQHARASGLPLGLQQVQHVSSEHGCRGDRLRRRGAVGNREAREHPLLLPSAARRHRGGGRGGTPCWWLASLVVGDWADCVLCLQWFHTDIPRNIWYRAEYSDRVNTPGYEYSECRGRRSNTAERVVLSRSLEYTNPCSASLERRAPRRRRAAAKELWGRVSRRIGAVQSTACVCPRGARPSVAALRAASSAARLATKITTKTSLSLA
mmetsp:Transcript_18201/g.61132  ORF Transcript_18201/g.61132 Transcript_18201/m.61132 type:complete len:276 (-) Transcript_18201:816-1643(-)